MLSKLNIAVVGAGFVGGSVINGFSTDTVELLVVDPVHSDLVLEDVIISNPALTFICLPTPQGAAGEVDVSIVEDVLAEIFALDYKGIVVIKSTITANHLKRFTEKFSTLRIIYNPEFLTEANAHQDFINPAMQILGGEWSDCEEVERAYVKHSKVKVVPTFKTDIVSASLLKYTINCWLATKVSFMNELYLLHKESNAGTSWEQFTDMLTRDPRIGNSHVRVPGPDGSFGFGGHCFPKDTQGMLYYAKHLGVDLSVLQTAVDKNKQLRDDI